MLSRSTTGLAIGLSVLLTGCSGSLGETLGFGKRAPDEFAVVKRQPLIVPPNYDLRPPDPNARGPIGARPEVRTRSTLTGVAVDQRVGAGLEGAAPGGTGAGEAALIRRSTEVEPDPAVRTRVAEETGGAVPVDEALFERLTAPGANGEGGELTVIRRSSTDLEDN